MISKGLVLSVYEVVVVVVVVVVVRGVIVRE